MRRIFVSLAAVLLLSVLTAGAVFAVKPPDGMSGNGAPKGAHFTHLNILGVEEGKEKTVDMDGTQGNSIFVPLYGACDIGLQEGDDFVVTDRNCLDDDGAQMLLMDPDSDGDRQLEYAVYIKVLQVDEGGSAEMRSCFTEKESGSTWCNAGDLVVRVSKNTDKFTDVSRELLQVCADVDPTDGTDLQLVPLFDDLGQDYFWHYQNSGVRHAQLRFYPLTEQTDLSEDCTGKRVSHDSIH